jgi:SRSO17 transposase
MFEQDTASWRQKLVTWLDPFLRAFPHDAQRQWAPYYLAGLLAPGERKSIECIADRVAPGERQQIHHFVSTSPWSPEPLETVLAQKAQILAGGAGASLIIDDTGLVKKGEHSVGVAHQYCGQLGKKANCQTVVTLTLARDQVVVPVATRLYLPEVWTSDPARCQKAGVPQQIIEQGHLTKPQIALQEIDRLVSLGVTFDHVLADAGYGLSPTFRHGLSERGLLWAVGVQSTQKMYGAGVKLLAPAKGKGRPGKHPRPSQKSLRADQVQAAWGLKWRRVTWREGTKGALQAHFWAVRVRLADGEKIARGQHLPGEEQLWLVGEKRSTGEIRYYVLNLPAKTSLQRLVQVIKSRWPCEQGHQQMKEELGLDHFEGRSWGGLHHHMLLVRIAYCFLVEIRRQKKSPTNACRPYPRSGVKL